MKEMPGIAGLVPENDAEAHQMGPQARLDLTLQILPVTFNQVGTMADAPEEVREALLEGVWSSYMDLGAFALEGRAKNMQGLMALACSGMIVMSYVGYLEQRIEALEKGTTLEEEKFSDFVAAALGPNFPPVGDPDEGADYPPLKRIELTEYQKAALARFHESNDALDDRKIDKEGDL